ncbi:rRNA maturation RNase YbeY [Antarcticibacterium flavum]|uniref:Endoribonuclease YbeY n=1 Tax=Antarcticibacterium flavum TaxID=2058175 RepID=A0A5B7X3G3_9FLAO|nr:MULTISPECIES: rRNA maturation RNase YbeY [Antarcticibacterium]MCM4159218.1 rRNA maturation RNase YbeY [Antarcticibacterium sp. W02-3]QCY69615.1 rRNA maturation RNase YbeY [Antarcticibacterium flavum]
MKPSKINFYSENSFNLEAQEKYAGWIERVISSEGKKLEEISYIFCDDEYLLKLNEEYLHHDTYTDIITFDYSVGKILQGDIYISTERVDENAREYNVSFEEELRRVIIHGVLHLAGYKDKTEEESSLMREKEEEKMKLFHVEQ